jgi:hypothetical protein
MTVSDDDLTELLDSERLARRTKVMFLRNGGVTWAKVAQEVGVSEKTARKDYEVVCRDINNEDPAHVVARHRAQLYDITRAMYPRLMGQNFDQAKDAAVVILRAQDREAKLLGLDSPTRVLASLSNEDFATEAARLITSIQTLDAATLKELSSGQPEIIDAEVDDSDQPAGAPAPCSPQSDSELRADAAQPVPESVGHPGPGDGRGDPQGAGAVPSQDSATGSETDAIRRIGRDTEEPDGDGPGGPVGPTGPDTLPDDDDDWSNL